MSKILLVEDDQNLSEIYNARLSAEGYEVLDAANGEDALAIAAKEKPDLVISDVMMPRVSGFEMLDILRHTDGMQGVKIIMLTALGQDNDRSKASELGADRYLVKSQVTLEDIVNTTKELLGDATAPADSNDTVDNTTTQPSANTAAPVDSTPAPASTSVVPPVEPPADLTKTGGSSPTDGVSTGPDITTMQPSAASPVDDTPVEPPATVSNTSTPGNLDDTGADSAASASTTNPTPDLASAEPMAEEEAELQQQLAAGPTDEQDSAPTTPAPTEPPADRQVGSPDLLPPAPTDVEPEPQSASGMSSEHPTTSSTTTAPPADTPLPTTEPTHTTPVAPSNELASTGTDSTSQTELSGNHDEVLAAALKELESDPSQPQTNSDNTNTAAPLEPASTTNNGSGAISGHKVIQPPDAADKPDINQLLAKDAEAGQGQPVAMTGQSAPPAMPTTHPQPAEPSDLSQTPSQSTPPSAPDSPNNISL